MNIRSALAMILCGALVFSAQAMPIRFSQIVEAQVGQQTSSSSTSQTASPTTGSTQEPVKTNVTVESPDHPEFVRLADGRLIPYGPGVICSEACVESDVIENPPGMSKRWLIAIPIAGAAIAGILLASGETRLPRPPTNVGGTSQEPSPTPTPTPNPNPTPTPTPPGGGDQPQPVPEPGTIALLGAGLALLSRKRVREIFKRNQK